MTKSCQPMTYKLVRASLLAPPQTRFFSDWGADSTAGSEAGGEPQAERVPRFLKHKFVLFNIPAGVTKGELMEKVKDHGVAEDRMSYQSQEETGDERGGRCFFEVADEEVGEKLMAELSEGIDVGGKTLIPMF